MSLVSSSFKSLPRLPMIDFGKAILSASEFMAAKTFK